MTCSDWSEGKKVTIRVTKVQLATMADAKPFYSDGPPQTPTQVSRLNKS